MQLSHDQLCQLIPHAGKMCLLDSVIDWNSEEIQCRATSQTAADNPLRYHHSLAAINGVEYAAQAMAIHGALLSDNRERPRIGYLAALRDVKLLAESLHQESELLLHCRKLAGDSNGFIYTFEVHGTSALLVSGRATVITQGGAHA
jgi:predicted hotdog family 3-hydroxylacyl-ACP dehydratase